MKPEVVVDSKGVRKLKVSFSLWPNDRREKDSQPNTKGYDKETGVSAVAWTKEHSGTKFLSGMIEIPLSALPSSVMDEFVATPPPELDDRIPF